MNHNKMPQKCIMYSKRKLSTNVVAFIILISIIGIGVFAPSVLNIFADT